MLNYNNVYDNAAAHILYDKNQPTSVDNVNKYFNDLNTKMLQTYGFNLNKTMASSANQAFRDYLIESEDTNSKKKTFSIREDIVINEKNLGDFFLKMFQLFEYNIEKGYDKDHFVVSQIPLIKEYNNFTKQDVERQIIKRENKEKYATSRNNLKANRYNIFLNDIIENFIKKTLKAHIEDEDLKKYCSIENIKNRVDALDINWKTDSIESIHKKIEEGKNQIKHEIMQMLLNKKNSPKPKDQSQINQQEEKKLKEDTNLKEDEKKMETENDIKKQEEEKRKKKEEKDMINIIRNMKNFDNDHKYSTFFENSNNNIKTSNNTIIEKVETDLKSMEQSGQQNSRFNNFFIFDANSKNAEEEAKRVAEQKKDLDNAKKIEQWQKKVESDKKKKEDKIRQEEPKINEKKTDEKKAKSEQQKQEDVKEEPKSKINDQQPKTNIKHTKKKKHKGRGGGH